jgi:CRISPR-associated protein Csb2
VPSIARLHAALLCAAGFGPRAVRTGPDSLDVREEDRAALLWLEANPPDSVSIPALHVNIAYPVAYRDDGTIKRTKSAAAIKAATIKKLDKTPGGGTAVAGRFAWIWSVPPPPEVRAPLEALCPDVGYLGTTESPARLTVCDGEEIEPTADLDQNADMFTSGVTAVARPLPGRTAELTQAHEQASGKPPSPAQDRIGTDEKSLSPVPPRRSVAAARYRQRARAVAAAPWDTAIVLPLSRVISEEKRVRWAVAAHRKLVSLIGYGAPPLVTGIYPPGSGRPANRLALHVLGPETPKVPFRLRDGQGNPRSALLLLVPANAEAGDLETLQRALAGLSSLYGPGGEHARVDQAAMLVLDGGEFWEAPDAGCTRLWETVPAAVPDTRGNAGWTFADAALLSLAFVWKGRLPKAEGRGDQYYEELVEAVRAQGAQAVQAQPMRTSDVGRYAHKVNEHAVVRPYRAVLSLGHLSGDRVVQAIGQSRHLGGALLVPRDIPSTGSDLATGIGGDSGSR